MRGGVPHILGRKELIPLMGREGMELIYEIVFPLAGQSGRLVIALRGRSVTPSTIANREIIRLKRSSRGEGYRKDRHFRTEVLHNPRSLA
jgi:hypothetical protein